MKGISVWIWVIAGIIVGFIMFAVSLQFISFVTMAREKELARGNLDDLASNINGLCTNSAGSAFTNTVEFPEKVTAVYATSDTRSFVNNVRTYGRNLCMNFSSEIICDDVNCDLEMETINSGVTLQNLLNQFLGRFGTNSYFVQISKTDCGVAVLLQNSQTTCGQSTTTTIITTTSTTPQLV
jgi:hypothetical protein